MKVWLLILDMGSIIIWNARGIGARDKKRCLRNLVHKFRLDVLGILETKLENITDCIVNSIWGRCSRDWYDVPSSGLSGVSFAYGTQLLSVFPITLLL